MENNHTIFQSAATDKALTGLQLETVRTEGRIAPGATLLDLSGDG